MKRKDSGPIAAGRPRLKPWEQKITATFRLEQETYQRIVRLAKREGRSMSAAVELLIRTQESEKIEPTLPVDYSILTQLQKGYMVSQILDSK
jgi:predicted DNA-binding protein